MIGLGEATPFFVETTARQGRLRSAVRGVGPIGAVVLPGLVAFLVACAAFSARVTWVGHTFLIVIGFVVVVAVVGLGAAAAVAAPGAREWRATVRAVADIVRDWLPLVTLGWMYQNLSALSVAVGRPPIDTAISRFDLAVLRVEPAAASVPLRRPWLTDIMGASYAMFIVLPIAFGLLLYVRGLHAEFRLLAVAVALEFCAGFLLWVLFPALPPRFFPPLQGTLHLDALNDGAVNSALQSFWDGADPLLRRSAFPAIHWTTPFIATVFAFRFGGLIAPARRWLPGLLCLVITVSIWASTFYLAHHWFADAAAGMALGVVCLVVAPPLCRRLAPTGARVHA